MEYKQGGIIMEQKTVELLKKYNPGVSNVMLDIAKTALASICDNPDGRMDFYIASEALKQIKAKESDEIQFAIDKWSASAEFDSELESVIVDMAEQLRNDDDGEIYGRAYDCNPYGVESHLVGNSGGWEYTEIALEQSYIDAKTKIAEELAEKDCDCVFEWLADYGIDEDFVEWDFLIEKITSKINKGGKRC